MIWKTMCSININHNTANKHYFVVDNFNELDKIVSGIHKENKNAKKWHNMRFHMKNDTLCARIYAQKEKSYNLGSNNLKTLVLNGRLFK